MSRDFTPNTEQLRGKLGSHDTEKKRHFRQFGARVGKESSPPFGA